MLSTLWSVFLNDTLLTIFCFETFHRDVLLTVPLVMKDVLIPTDILTAITPQPFFQSRVQPVSY